MTDIPSPTAEAARIPRFGIPVILLVLIQAVVIGVLLQLAVQGQDAAAREASEDIAQTAFRTQRAEMEGLVRDYSWWDEAVYNLVFEFDADWAAEDLAGWLHGNFDVNRTFVFAPQRKPLHATLDAEPIPTDDPAWQVSAFIELIEHVDQLPEEPKVSASGYVAFPDGVYLVAASTLLVEDASLDHPAYPHKGILVVARRIDEEHLAQVAREFQLPSLALRSSIPPGDDRARLEFLEQGGEAVAYLVWTPSRPGQALLQSIMLPLGLVFAVTVILLGVIIIRARHAGRALRVALDAQFAAQEKLAYMARHDSLTGVANRALFLEYLQTESAHGTRNGPVFAVHYLDLDKFKVINDTHGHAAGDAVLVEVAARLTRSVRSADTVARFGGDEFAILQRGVDEQAAAGLLAERINRAVIEPIEIDGVTVEIGVSIGIAFSSDNEDAESLLALADRALYRVKSEGGNGYRFRDPDDPVPSGSSSGGD